MNNDELAERLRGAAQVDLKPASRPDLEKLAALGVPEDLMAFYRRFEPTECADLGDVRLWPITEIVGENTDFVPGAYLFPKGFVVFSTTSFGDTFCFRRSVRDSGVLLFSHEIWYEELSPSAVASYGTTVAANFGDFLEMALSDTLQIEPKCPSL
jgi:hypothetical protein